MSFDLFYAVVIFIFVMTFAPGPNTMMLLASGVNFGFRARVPHMAGIALDESGRGARADSCRAHRSRRGSFERDSQAASGE
jgi:hypothetical protein